MPVKIAVLKETRANERRVALVPAVADKLVKLGAELHMQSSAGDAVKLPDSAFKTVSFAANPQGLVSDADIVLSVQPPSVETVGASKPVNNMSHTIKKATPVFSLSGSSGSKLRQKFSTAFIRCACLRAWVM